MSALLICKSNQFSQNGEDGVIDEIFRKIGTTTKTFCEFGAWDGIHFSNCRNLALQGWSGVMIEGDEPRFSQLVETYKQDPSIVCVNQFVNTGDNTLDNILQVHNMTDLDFLSIDIDGLDYEILESLKCRPRVICIEVNAGHSPAQNSRLERNIAKENIGQPFPVFVDITSGLGYDLVCYTGNAFFIQKEITGQFAVKPLSATDAYLSFLNNLSASEKNWLYQVNLGWVPPYYQFKNPFLSLVVLRVNPFWVLNLVLQKKVTPYLKLSVFRKGLRKIFKWALSSFRGTTHQ